jgi:hypothetical protein
MPRLSDPFTAAFGAAALALSLAVALPAAAQSDAPGDVESQSEAAPLTKGEKELAKLLEGRVAGKPVSCIRTLRNDQMQTIDRTAYVYGRGNTIYVQRTADPAGIDDLDTLVITRFNSSDLCRLDRTVTIDPFTGILTGVVFFEDFVPYTRVKAPKSSEG